MFLLASFAGTRTPPLKQIFIGDRAVRLSAPKRLVSRPMGGGERSPLPAPRGRAPQMHTRRVFLPPVAQIRNEHPRLVLEQALLNAPDFNIDAANVGDPMGLGRAPSEGPGGPLGIGSGFGKGVGRYDGPGGKSEGSPSRERVRVSRQPQLIYQVEPEYSEEARKVKYQGSVILAIEVDLNGSAANIRVVRSAGLGLDAVTLN